MIRLLRRVRYWLLRDRFEEELEEELEVHRRLKQAGLEASGLSEPDAARASRRALGNLTLAREDARAIWIWPWLESLWQDLRTVGMDLTAGRDFSPLDTLRSAKVAIVNESLVREHFNGRNPTGRRITIGRHASRRDLDIVGVVSDARYRRLEERPASTAYLPLSQLAETVAREDLFAEVRAASSIGSVGEGVRLAVRSMDPRVPVRIETVADRIRESLVRERVIAELAAWLGLAALTLASAALYGLLSYGVSRRSREIGLRIALGADRRAIIWMVVRECFWLATVGIVIGLGASLVLGRYARTLLHQIDAADGVSLTAASLLMLMVAGLAGLLPAVRAARVDPATALRSD